jgi:protease-4
MKQFFLTLAGVFAGMTIFFVGLPVLFVIMALSAPKGIPTAAVLNLDLRRNLHDQDVQSPFAALSGRAVSVMSIVQTLNHAERDPRVRGLLIRLPEGGIAPGSADELRLAIRRFEASGKTVIAHSQGLYPTGAAISTYMLGAASSQLWMQPGASFQATGLAQEDLFFKRLFDRYGVKADYLQRAEFKNAVNPLLYDDYTPAHREAQLSWMGSIYRTALLSAAVDRHRDPAALVKLVEAGPYAADKALALGLIDKVGQVKDAEDAALKGAGRGARLLDFSDYARAVKRLDGPRGAPKIAVIYAEGEIVTGTSEGGRAFSSAQTIYSDDVADALYDAAKDKDVKAIVFRVSSPGGQDTASEQILAAVRAAKAAGKPVVVSMGEYGASGGYWISSGASAIVAEPTTLTGSIGVYGGKLALGQTLARYGVDVRQTQVGGAYASADSMGQGFTPDQRAAFANSIDAVYDGFIQRVAVGRKLTPDRVREIAKGRVWTGAQARSLGLVDGVGGFYEAVAKAKALAGITGDVRLKTFESGGSALGALGQALGASGESAHALVTVAALLSSRPVERATSQLRRAEMIAAGADVLAPTPDFH